MLLFFGGALHAQSVNIAPMTWTPRPDWIVVTGTFSYNGVNYHAAGDGVTDDTAAIQAAMNVCTTLSGTTSMNGKVIATKAVYLPAGTYKITNTLHWRNFFGGYLVGCGCNTIVQWAGASGAAMFWADGASWARFVGITWDGKNIASCAYEHVNNNSYYAGRCRHENEAFMNFTVNGTYMPTMILPAAGIISCVSDVVTGTNTYTVASGTSTIPGTLTINIGNLVSGTAATPITGTALSGTLTLRSGTAVLSGITVTNGTLTSGTGTLNLATSSTGTVVSGTVAVVLPIEVGQTNSPTAEMLVTNCLFQSCSNGLIVGYNGYNDYQWIVDGCEFENCGTAISIPIGILHVLDTHFQNSSVQDISQNAGHSFEIRRCTSQGSAQFVTGGADIIEDCWIDQWTGIGGAISLQASGPTMIMDCAFTNPVNATAPCITLINSNIHYVTLSGNYCSNPTVPMITPGATASVVNIPCGARTGNLTSLSSGSTIFLSSTTPFIGDGSANATILDVTGTNFAGGAKGTGKYYAGIWYGDDDHDAIQAAINQAKANNNGSIVYFPTIRWYGSTTYGYRLNSSLQVSGSNYTIEQGGWGSSYLMWGGTGAGSLALTGTMMAVTSPQNIVLKRLYFLTGESTFLGGTGAQIGYPPQTGLYVTSAGPCSLVMEDFTLTNDSGYYQGGNGVVLANLPAGALVYLERLNSPLVVRDCGQAEILAKHALPGTVMVSAPNTANTPKTGFLGFMVGQQGLGTSGSSDWSMLIDDNQDLVIGSYYNDGDANHLWVRRGAATGNVIGRVTIQGNKDGRGVAGSGYTPTLLEMDDYAGRVMYGPQHFPYGIATSPIVHTGSNALDLILANDTWGTYSSTITDNGTGLNLIQFQNSLSTTGTTQWGGNILPAGYGPSVAQGLDHVRQLGFEDLKLRYGITQTVTNSSFETDSLNSAPLTSAGTTPNSWTVTGGTTTASGVRAVSVTGTGSPFASGAQSAAFVDTTGTAIGTPLSFLQNIAALSSRAGAVFSFDFQLNSMASLNDAIKISVFAGTSPVFSVELTASGTAGLLGSAPLAFNTWYRVRADIPPPASPTSTVLFTVTPWTVNGPGSPSTYVAPGISGTLNQGMSSISFVQSAAGNNTNVNFDNITLVAGDPLVITIPSVTITTQPQDTGVCVGQTATFSVAATGSSALSYQWLKNGVVIPGANSASYSSPAAVIGDNGTAFSVVVTSSIESVTSDTATLSVFSPPIFEADFNGTGAGTGGTNDLVLIGGSGALGTSSQTTYTISSASSMGQGKYLNIATSSTSGSPKTISQFNPATNANSWTALAGTVISGSTTYTTFNGAFDLFVRPNVTGSNSNGWFRPLDFDTRSGNSGLRTTLWGVSSPNGLQLVMTSPSSTAFGSDGVTWNVSSVGINPVYFNFVTGTVYHIAFTWSTNTKGLVTARLYAAGNGTAIDTASSANLVGTTTFYANASTIGSNPLISGPWSLLHGINGVVTNADYDTVRLYATIPGVFPAIGATLPTGTAPTITTPPQNTSVFAGQPATFTVVAAGAPAPAYQWQQNGIPIVGATSATYTTPVTALTDNGTTFSIVLSNTAGTVTSGTAMLTVNPSFASWQSTWFTAPELAIPAISGFTANPSGDGMSNLMKYALNLDPKQPNSSSAPTCNTVISSGTTYLYLTHRVNRLASDILYRYEQSTGLTSWTPITPEVFSTVHLDATTDSVTVRAPAPANTSRFFMHLRIDR